MDINLHIHKKFRIKGYTTLPLTGWMDSTRTHLGELFCELGYKVGAEIGVQRGINAQMMCERNPGVKLFCIDPWEPFSRRRNLAWQEHVLGRAKIKLAPYNVVFIRKKSMDALADIPDNSLDFVYIDAMHDFDNAMMDIIGWSNKVKSGGIVSGHDYNQLPGNGVIQAVRGYVDGHAIYPWYVTRDLLPSYFWVKP